MSLQWDLFFDTKSFFEEMANWNSGQKSGHRVEFPTVAVKTPTSGLDWPAKTGQPATSFLSLCWWADLSRVHLMDEQRTADHHYSDQKRTFFDFPHWSTDQSRAKNLLSPKPYKRYQILCIIWPCPQLLRTDFYWFWFRFRTKNQLPKIFEQGRIF